MSICSEHKDRQLRDYFLNRLSAEEVEAFQFHLFHCETCRKNLERMRLLAQGGEEERDPASDGVEPNVEKRRLLLPAFTRVAAVACIVLALAAGGIYYHLSRPDDGLQLEMNEPPLLHSGDSIESDADSTAVKSDEKGEDDGVE